MRLLSGFEMIAARMVGASSSSIHASVPPVLHSIVATTSQSARDFGPALTHFGHHSLNLATLLVGDGIMVEVGFQVLMVALSALLW